MKALVTGANRGIGLELCQQLANADYEVYAACRTSSPELEKVTPNVMEGIDVGCEEVLERLKNALVNVQLDLVINCAGILERVTWDDFDFASATKQFQINTLGPFRVIKAVEDNIVNGGKIAMITSRMGSVADNTSGGQYGYRMSKAALNIGSVSLAQDLKGRQIAVAIIHPGYVQTAMTGFGGDIDAATSASGILSRIEALNLDNSGTFWHQNGEVLPW